MEEVRVKKKWSISKILLIIIGSLFGVFAIVLIFTVNKELKAEERLIEMRDYILDTDQETLSSWQDYKEENEEKMGYIKEMLTILNDYPDTWFVKDYTLYFSDDDLLREYNTYYDLLVEEDSTMEGIKI